MSTGLNAFSEGGLYDFIQSPLYARGNPDITMQVQILLQEKQWPGLGTFNILPGGNLPPDLQPDDPAAPSFDDRWQHRLHYMDRNINYSGPDANYHTLETYAPPGFPWVTNGAPHYLIGNPTRVGPRDTDIFPTGTAPVLNPDLVTSDATFTENGGYTSYSFITNDPTYGTQTYTEGLGSEITSLDMISALQSRILQRGFDTAFDALTALVVFPEVFNEYDNLRFTGSLNPDAYDMSPIPLPARQNFSMFGSFFEPQLPQFFPSNSVNSSLEKYLFSYWNYESDDFSMVAAGGASDAKGLNNKAFYASRCRFRINKSVSYFIAEGRIIDWIPTLDNRLTDCTVLKKGVTTPNAIVDFGFIGDTEIGNFADVDFTSVAPDQGGLSSGQIRFVILNETPEAWSARTGITMGTPA